MPPQLVDSDNGEPAVSTTINKDEEVWIELLNDGLTFDLQGLAPGRPSAFPEEEHRFDLDQSPSTLALEGVHLLPGQHLAGAVNSPPVARAMIGIACDFVHGFTELEAVFWQPSSSVIGRRYFESIATAWLDGGAFPALGLTAFSATADGALQSVGLNFWTGQELRIEPPISSDPETARRLGARIINQLVLLGRVQQSEHVIGPDGTKLVLQPSRDGEVVRVMLG